MQTCALDSPLGTLLDDLCARRLRLARAVNERAAEIEHLTQMAKREGLVLSQATLHEACANGVMLETATAGARHFRVQPVQASNALVIHEAALLQAV